MNLEFNEGIEVYEGEWALFTGESFVINKYDRVFIKQEIMIGSQEYAYVSKTQTDGVVTERVRASELIGISFLSSMTEKDIRHLKIAKKTLVAAFAASNISIVVHILIRDATGMILFAILCLLEVLVWNQASQFISICVNSYGHLNSKKIELK